MNPAGGRGVRADPANSAIQRTGNRIAIGGLNSTLGLISSRLQFDVRLVKTVEQHQRVRTS
jgi:hypothetical protein